MGALDIVLNESKILDISLNNETSPFYRICWMKCPGMSKTVSRKKSKNAIKELPAYFLEMRAWGGVIIGRRHHQGLVLPFKLKWDLWRRNLERYAVNMLKCCTIESLCCRYSKTSEALLLKKSSFRSAPLVDLLV